jgi:hypothetical protein
MRKKDKRAIKGKTKEESVQKYAERDKDFLLPRTLILYFQCMSLS